MAFHLYPTGIGQLLDVADVAAPHLTKINMVRTQIAWRGIDSQLNLNIIFNISLYCLDRREITTFIVVVVLEVSVVVVACWGLHLVGFAVYFFEHSDLA